MRTSTAPLLALLLAALLAGCSPSSGERVEFDEDLKNAIIELAGSGGSRPLQELTPGDWTSVQVLTGPASGARIERELGLPVEVGGDGTYGGDYVQDGNLLVFLSDDEISRMVSLGQLAALRDGKYGADIVLQAEDGAIRLIDPDEGSAGS